MFPYRWLPRTVFKNISWVIRSIKDGIINIIRWTPIIWGDYDFDWEFLAKIMEYKLRRMSKCLNNGIAVNSDRQSRQTLICAELIKRLRADEWIVPITRGNVHRHVTRMKEWQNMLGKYIGKHLMWWWD